MSPWRRSRRMSGKELLARAVANEIRQGWRVESQTDYQAVIVKG